MRRGLWFAAGAGVGLYAAVRGRRAAEAFTPEGLRDRVQAVGLGARMLRDEVAQGKAEAEPRLRERFTPVPMAHAIGSTPPLTAGRDHNALEASQEGTEQ